LSQITSDIALEWEDPIIARWNRRRQVAVQAAPVVGKTYPALRSDVIAEFENIELPPGYAMEWDGEFKSTMDAQLSLIPGMAPALAIILIIIVALFNSMRPPFIMFLTIPFAAIGIIWVLVATSTPFGFMALLGAMSLVGMMIKGMMIKNAIVLLDEVNLNIDGGMGPYEATVQAAVSRLRPVVLAALTTVLGVLPLLQDAFWTSMAMTIMAGLTLGTALTMVVIPLFYVIFYRVPSPVKG
jgi:multidrug efflux pump subunit AcrB